MKPAPVSNGNNRLTSWDVAIQVDGYTNHTATTINGIQGVFIIIELTVTDDLVEDIKDMNKTDNLISEYLVDPDDETTFANA
ncbi:hypothetical protein HDU83_009401 [Entophlyctis luteolus]|nr:hypothetical protein HDU83_009401 [Entophlyctis luteolus]